MPPGTKIAGHWNTAGQTGRYGGKAEAFLLIPGIAVLLSLPFAAAPHIDPRGRNLAASGPVLMTVWIGTVGVLAIVQAALAFSALGVITADGEIVPRAMMLSVCADGHHRQCAGQGAA